MFHALLKRQNAVSLRGCFAALLVGVSALFHANAEDRWEPIGPFVATAFSYAVHPTDSSQILLGTYFNGVYKSDDAGLSWRHLDSGFGSALVFYLGADRMSPGTFYAATFERGIFKSTDTGTTWQQINAGLANQNIQCVEVSPLNSQLVFACSFAGSYISTNGGALWTASQTPNLPSLCVQPSRTYQSVAYLGTDGKGVYITNDGGVNWTQWNEGMGDCVVFDLSLHSSLEVVYAATNRGVFVRGAGDSSWTSLKFNLTDANINQVFQLPPPDNRLIAAAGTGVYYLTGAEDQLWDRLASLPARFVIPFPNGQRFLVAGFRDALHLTTDNGVSFSDSSRGVQNNFPDAMASFLYRGVPRLLAGTDSGVWRVDRPERGSRVWMQSASIADHLILALTPHPTRDGHVFAGTERAGVWFSSDGGAEWQQRTNGIFPTFINSLAQAPTGGHTFYAGTSVGFFVSQDNGRNWRMGSTVAVPSLITSVEADEVKENSVFYGTQGGEIFESINNRDFAPVVNLGSAIRALRTARFGGVYAVLEDGRVFSRREGETFWNLRPDGLPKPVLDLGVKQSESYIVYAGTAGAGVYKSASQGSLWEPANVGMENRFIFTLAIDDRAGVGIPATIYAGSVGAVFRSTDGAATWQELTSGLPAGKAITALVMNPDTGALYASALGDGVFASTDGGLTWNRIGAGTDFSRGALPLRVSVTQPRELFVGTVQKGVLRFDAATNSWVSSANGITDLVRGIVVGRDNPDELFAASLNSGVFRSRDEGLSWNYVGLDSFRLLHLEVRPGDDRTLYASTTEGLARSADGGETWVELGQRGVYVTATAFLDADRRELLVGDAIGTIYRSKDAGQTWLRLGTGLPKNPVEALATTGGNAFAGVDAGGLFRSVDSGNTWKNISGGAPYDFTQGKIVQIAPEPVFEQLYVASPLGGLFLTNFTGQSWVQLPLPRANFSSDPLTGVIIDPNNINRIYVSRDNQSGTLISLHILVRNAQGQWSNEQPAGLPGGSVHNVSASPAVPGLLLVGHADGVFRSTDNGLNWAATSLAGDDLGIYRVAFDRSDPLVAYASPFSGGIYRSVDGGQNWTPTTVPASAVVSTINSGHQPGSVYAGTFARGVLISADFGQTWTNGIQAEYARPVVNYLSIDPMQPDTMYMGTASLGVLKSTDGGLNFAPSNEGLGANLTLLSVLVDPVNPALLYAGTTTGGVFASQNRGATWSPLRAGIFHELVISLNIDPTNHFTVYAGVEGGGVYSTHRFSLDPGGDFDGDSLSNLHEEYLGSDPTFANPLSLGLLQLVSLPGDTNLSRRFVVEWERAQGIESLISGSLEWSGDLLTWHTLQEFNAPVTGTIVSAGLVSDGGERLRADVKSELSMQNLFFRLRFLRVSQP